MLAICMELLCHVISQLSQPSRQNEWTGFLERSDIQAVWSRGALWDRAACGRVGDLWSIYSLCNQVFVHVWVYHNESVCIFHAADLAAVTWTFFGVEGSMGRFNLWTYYKILCFNIYVVYMLLFCNAHKHTFAHAGTHTLHMPHGPWFLYFFGFLRRQQHGVLKIDLVSEAESVYSLCSLCFLWSRPPSFILLKTYTLLYGFRDTTSDLHLAEHKWVKRKYNTEQSPLLTPPGAYRLLQSAPALFMPLSVLSTSQTRLRVCSNGVGHQALFKMEKKKRNKYWFENVLFCYF